MKIAHIADIHLDERKWFDETVRAFRAALRDMGTVDHIVVADNDIREIAVITYPHAVEDTFHRDWASRARDELHVPVLHLYSGTSALG